jgi:hypothetical protein
MELVSRRDEFQLKHFFQLRIIRGNHPWQIEVDVANRECNLSLGETSSNWNSSLQETRRLFPKNVFKQCFLAK